MLERKKAERVGGCSVYFGLKQVIRQIRGMKNKLITL